MPVHPARSAERAALELFEEVIDLDDPARRDAVLAERTRGNPALLERVRRLIAADTGGDSPPNESAGPGHARAVLPPAQVGPYRLDELIGTGGMGAVYRASRADGLFEQTVAIKFVRPLRGQIAVEPLIDAERRLLARMQHPAIARILDGGTTANGLHYLVMEHVEGVPLDRYVAEQRLDERRTVGLVGEVCAAVAHAHGHLVLHNDIKPDNILVTAGGEPKLIDFGVARLQNVVDAALPEGMTRAYASPQRLAGEPGAVADDVFALGRVLGEALRGGEPAANERRAPVDPELAAIVGRATAAAREQRYASAGALAEDLQRWLDRRPVAAVGSQWRYRARKLLQRNPWRVAAAASALAGLVGALAVIAALYGRAESARRDAEQRFDQVRALATYMLFDLDARLEATPGTTAARREMVGRSQQYLDALAAGSADNPALQREVAVGLMRLAEVQGVPGRAHVGEPAAAKANLQRAEALLEATAQRTVRGWQWHADRARLHYLMALLVGGRENDLAGQLGRARRAEQEALAALAAAGREPAAADARVLAELHGLLTSTRLTQGDAHKNLAEHDKAAALQRAEEDRLAALAAEVKAGMDYEYQTGRAALMLGDSLYYLDRKVEALAAYRRGTQRFGWGLARAPTDRRLLIGALTGHWYLSSVIAEAGRPDEALRESDLALQIGTRMLELDPQNLEAARMRNAVLADRALVLAAVRRFDEAIALVEDMLVEREARAREAPDDFERARDAAVPLRLLADHYRNKGDRSGACRVLRRALQAWTDLDRRWTLSDFDRRGELEPVRSAAGRCPG
jgi:serine/threonine-protein kinase